MLSCLQLVQYLAVQSSSPRSIGDNLEPRIAATGTITNSCDIAAPRTGAARIDARAATGAPASGAAFHVGVQANCASSGRVLLKASCAQPPHRTRCCWLQRRMSADTCHASTTTCAYIDTLNPHTLAAPCGHPAHHQLHMAAGLGVVQGTVSAAATHSLLKPLLTPSF